MNVIFRAMLGNQKYCLTFHVPQVGHRYQWFGPWCRSCAIYHGGSNK